MRRLDQHGQRLPSRSQHMSSLNWVARRKGAEQGLGIFTWSAQKFNHKRRQVGTWMLQPPAILAVAAAAPSRVARDRREARQTVEAATITGVPKQMLSRCAAPCAHNGPQFCTTERVDDRMAVDAVQHSWHQMTKTACAGTALP